MQEQIIITFYLHPDKLAQLIKINFIYDFCSEPVIVVGSNASLPCQPSPCDPYATCNVYRPGVAMCDPCGGPGAAFNPACHPECLTNADCPFDKACLGGACRNPCPGSCGVNAQCLVWHHNPLCSCPHPYVGNPFEHCLPPPPGNIFNIKISI